MKSLWLFILLISMLPALTPIEITSSKISILDHCDKLSAENGFVPLMRDHLNLGLHHQEVWLHCQIKNSHDHQINHALYISSPLLEHISLIEKNQTTEVGMLVESTESRETLSYYFPITLSPQSTQEYYLRVQTIYTPLDFSIFLEEMHQFLHHDRETQLFNMFLLGIIVALMLYAAMLACYMGDRSYFYYALYLLALLYQQVTYLGIMQLYMPSWMVLMDAKITIVKIGFLIITSALFSMSFLETKRFLRLHWGYLGIIVFAMVEALVLDPKEEIGLYMMILTGAIFILYNLLVGIWVYTQGKKEARLFIVGFALVFFSYLLMIIDALGIASVMLHFRNLLLLTTAIEALILSLAFADRYLILQKSKATVDRLILEEAKNRESIIRAEVIKKTKALKHALQEKELLMKEIHHRVKNNLQIILSMIRLQNDALDDPTLKEMISQLEMRINAIAKTYTNLITNNSLHQVDMDRYLSSLLEDLSALYDPQHHIRLQKEITVQLPFKKAVYIGLIVNELVTNAYKHAFTTKREGVITICLYQEKEGYYLEIKDSGKGFSQKSNGSSLGLMLIETLVIGQLHGTLKRKRKEGTVYIIRFLGGVN